MLTYEINVEITYTLLPKSGNIDHALFIAGVSPEQMIRNHGSQNVLILIDINERYAIAPFC